MSETEVRSRPTPGQLLRKARERTGLSFEAIAEQLKMTVTKIRALEEDNHQPFPADTYLKGYLRNYARIVNLSEAEVIDSYEHFVAAHRQQSSNTNLDEAVAQSKANNKKKVLLLLLVILFAIVASYYYLGDQAKSTSPASDSQKPERSSESTLIDNTKIENTATENRSGSELNSRSSPSQLSNALADGQGDSVNQMDEPIMPLAAELEAGNESPPESQGDNNLPLVEQSASTPASYVFSFTDNCWLEVVDSKGNKIIAKQYAAGDTVSLEGLGPFKVLLGNARAARLRYNGKPVTITPLKDKNTLRLTLKQ